MRIKGMNILLLSITLLNFNVLAKESNIKHTFLVEKVISVYDGDTFRADLASGHPLISKNIRIRLSGIDTPEIKGKCWKEKELAKRARDYLSYRLEMSDKVVLRNVKRGKYFRLVADVYLDGKSINEELLDKGLAHYYKEGRGRKLDWCDETSGFIQLRI